MNNSGPGEVLESASRQLVRSGRRRAIGGFACGLVGTVMGYWVAFAAPVTILVAGLPFSFLLGVVGLVLSVSGRKRLKGTRWFNLAILGLALSLLACAAAFSGYLWNVEILARWLNEVYQVRAATP
jgi:hypothetical protein